MLIFGQSLTPLFQIYHCNDLVHRESIDWSSVSRESHLVGSCQQLQQEKLSLGLRINAMVAFHRGEAFPFLGEVYRV